MTRPSDGPPPTGTSSVAIRERDEERLDHVVYGKVVEAFDRPDRRSQLLAMFGGDDDLLQRFIAVALNAIATDSDLLLNATPASIIQAVKDSATLGLEPTGLTGEAVIIRYGKVAKLMPMYRGYLKRIRNTGKIRFIETQLVYANDEFDYWYNETGGHFTHHPIRPSNPTGVGEDGKSERGDYWGAYGYAVFPSGWIDLEVMPAVDINQIRDRYSASAGKAGPWDTAYGEMAKKTVLRRMAKTLPQHSTDIAAAVDDLLRLDAEADNAREEAEAGAKKLDVSKARQAALAAVAGGRPDIADPDALGASEVVSGDVVDEGDADSDEPPFPPLS